ncbi:sensor histidine kinase KdpD [Planomonospora sp. ID82291]|uniref:sensor histidine kinase n=1 Tax=Planomonospora sp. ID82291 TaxID=2738136 RepID=UPI0018C3EDF4|nr:HAMP domain-containing sensor histidine kinase [Planomonospora sp. ID82291]MBG0814880.1 HAMP domain-containing histidine kinase [Planomonospora sp. ID82291]
MRISTRFAACFAVLVPLLVLLAGLLVLNLVSRDLHAERDRQLSARLSALKPVAAAYVWRVRSLPGIPPAFLEHRMATTAAGTGSTGGAYLAVTGSEPLAVGNVPAVPPAALPAGGTARPAGFSGGGREWRFMAADLGLREGSARLWVFDPEERLAGQIRLLARRVVAATLVAAGAGAAGGLALGRFAVRPLAVLRRQARTIGAPSRTGVRLTTGSGVAEVDELAGLFNTLLDRRDAAVVRTGEALESARAFAVTAAHELRTPLTSMGTNLDLLGHPELDEQEQAEVIADLRAEHARMQRTITMLRRLSLGELLDPETFTGTDLAGIVADAVEEARRRHPHAEIACLPAPAAGSAEPVVHGWAEGLRTMVDNLLDNAAVHGADEHGRAAVVVTIGLVPDEGAAGEAEAAGTTGSARAAGTIRSAGGVGTVVLTVQDSGPGIPSADREAVFTRFHRRAGSPGSGLGLTLVRQQVALHGGTVTVTAPEEGRGTRIEVRLPAAGRSAPRPAARSWLERPPSI